MTVRLIAAAHRQGLAALALAAGLMPCGPAHAGDIDIRVRDCRSNVDVRAQNARLSDVFARLARELDFQVRMDGPADPVVNVHLSAPAPQLIAELAARHGSFMIQHASDVRCPGMHRVATVWFTSGATGAAAPAPPAAQAARKTRAAVVPVTETATPARLRQVEEEARRRKEAYEIHVRRHGKPPPGEPEEAATP